MELKDAILSTLAEMEEEIPTHAINNIGIKEKKVFKLEDKVEKQSREEIPKEKTPSIESELVYLSSVRERLLVLFEGFQAPNNKDIEAKVDMTLNFLEYVLATIDSRVKMLQERDK